MPRNMWTMYFKFNQVSSQQASWATVPWRIPLLTVFISFFPSSIYASFKPYLKGFSLGLCPGGICLLFCLSLGSGSSFYLAGWLPGSRAFFACLLQRYKCKRKIVLIFNCSWHWLGLQLLNTFGQSGTVNFRHRKCSFRHRKKCFSIRRNALFSKKVILWWKLMIPFKALGLMNKCTCENL